MSVYVCECCVWQHASMCVHVCVCVCIYWEPKKCWHWHECHPLPYIQVVKTRRSSSTCPVLCLVAQSYPTLEPLWTAACQAPLPRGFSRQEYSCGLPCPPPGGLPNPRTEPVSFMSPALAGRCTQLVTNPPAIQKKGLIPGLGRSPGQRKGYPLQYSGLENSMDCII